MRRPKADPSPDEILRLTNEIRAEWTERTFRIRSGWPTELADQVGMWTAPEIHLADLEPVWRAQAS